ncbi:universal stress protein [Ramlibacter albus]|uniref:Universal stress protein n=1 Tax=Ramlibacter albus TaxID=2079448 RepID=A0A923M687_9BURK|nr:universal stress protein [Ramlibacter albus]
MFKNILFATDGSAASEHAAQLAVKLARRHDSRLTAVYVVDPYPYLGIGEANPVGMNAYLSAAREHAAAAHAKIGELAAKDGGHIQLECVLLEDVTADKGILRAAENTKADLVVVGSHGRTGIQRLILGSIAAKVVAASPVPVLVAR